MRLRIGVSVLLLAALSATAAEWSARYDGPGHGSDAGSGISLSGDGHVYVAGLARGADASPDMVGIGYVASTGVCVQAVPYAYLVAGGLDDSAATVAAIAGASGAYVAGYSTDESGENNPTQYTVLKFNSGMNLLWDSTYRRSNADENGTSILAAVEYDGGLIATGTCYWSGAYGYEVVTARFGADGGLAWASQFTGSTDDDDDAGLDVCLDAAGRSYVTGVYTPEDGDDDVLVLKYDQSGSEVFSCLCDFGAGDAGRAIAADGAGNCYVAADVVSPSNGHDVMVIKVSSTGDTVWTRRYDGPGHGNDSPCELLLDGAGNVVVAATSDSAGGDDMLVLKYNPSGQVLWTRRYDGPDHLADSATAMALDAYGCIYVAGSRQGTSTGADYFAIAYSPSGDTLGEWTYNGPVDGRDRATAIAVDPAGTALYVTGCSDSATTDIVTCRFEQTFDYDIAVVGILAPPGSIDSGQTSVPVAVVQNNSEGGDSVFTAVFSIGTAYSDTLVDTLPVGQTDTLHFAEWQASPSGSLPVRCTVLVTDSLMLNNVRRCTVTVAPTGWAEKAQVTATAKAVKDGAWLVYNPSDSMLYMAKGYKTGEFYRYSPPDNSWVGTPEFPEGDHRKYPFAGSAACCDGERYIYATKGNTSLEFWRYDIADSAWVELETVPRGPNRRKVKGGTDLVYVGAGDSGFVYLLKGGTCEFYRFNTASGGWQTQDSAPVGAHAKWDKGSWLAYDGAGTIYAHKAKYQELWAFDVGSGEWGTQPRARMPTYSSQTHRTKRSSDGGAAVWFNGVIYALKGNNTQEFWQYKPSKDSWAELETIPWFGSTNRKKGVKAGGDIVAADGRLYALKGNKTYEFWRYLPASGGQDLALFPFSLAPGRIAPQRDGETPFVDSIEAFSPRWSGDGSVCTYSREDDDGWLQVMMTDRDSGHSTQLTDDSTDHEFAVPSEKGDFACMQVFDEASQRYQIGLVEAASPCSVLLLTGSEYDHELPELDPSNEHVVFQVDDDQGFTQLGLVSVTGGDEYLLTTDQADHLEPSFLNDTTVVFTYSPADGSDYDQIGRLDVNTRVCKTITEFEYDHEAPSSCPGGQDACFQVLVDGTWQVGTVGVDGDDEQIVSHGTTDKEEPDWSADKTSIYCVNWLGLTSEIGWVDASTGDYTPTTDSSAIRDNPDVYFDSVPCENLVLYERSTTQNGPAWDGGKKKRPGNGIFMVSHAKKPKDGQMGMPIRILALNRAKPNPVTGRAKVHINWAVPKEELVSLKVYNTAGQVARVLHQGMTKPGQYTTIWDGTDAQGRRLAAGVYFYALATEEKRLSRKVVLAER